MSVVDWTSAPEPWSDIGPRIAASLLKIAVSATQISGWSLTDGLKLRHQRRALGMTQNQLAHSIGYSESSGATISKWEKGNAEPPARALHNLTQIGIKC